METQALVLIGSLLQRKISSICPFLFLLQRNKLKLLIISRILTR